MNFYRLLSFMIFLQFFMIFDTTCKIVSKTKNDLLKVCLEYYYLQACCTTSPMIPPLPEQPFPSFDNHISSPSHLETSTFLNVLILQHG